MLECQHCKNIYWPSNITVFENYVSNGDFQIRFSHIQCDFNDVPGQQKVFFVSDIYHILAKAGHSDVKRKIRYIPRSSNCSAK